MEFAKKDYQKMIDIATSGVVKIVVPGEPKPYRERSNPYVRKRPGKRGQPVGSLGINSVKPKAHEDYQKRISGAAVRAMLDRTKIEGPVRLTVRAYVPIPKKTNKTDRAAIAAGLLLPVKRPDLTNIIKLAEDALSGIVFKDDNQVVRHSDRSGRFYSYLPRIEIEVEAIDAACPLQAAEMDREDLDEIRRLDPVGAASIGSPC